MVRRHRAHFGFTAFIVAGVALSVMLLAQTVWTYVFVSRDLVRREARRQAGRDVAALERAIFAGRIRELALVGAVLSDLHQDASTRLAWVTVVGLDGHTLAESTAGHQTLFTRAELAGAMFSRDEPSATAWRDTREVLVYVFPLRLPFASREGIAGSAPITAPGTGPAPPSGRRGPVLAEVGIFSRQHIGPVRWPFAGPRL